MQISQQGSSAGGAPEQSALGPIAVGAVALAIVLAAIGTFAETGDADTRGFLVICAVITVAAVAVFGFVVPRGLRRESAGVSALVLSVLGLLTVAVFWSGLPPILAAGGMLLGWSGLNASRGRWLCRVAFAIGALALVADIGVAVGDWVANN